MKTKAKPDSVTLTSQERSPQYLLSMRGEMGRLLLLRLKERDQTVQSYLNQLVLEDLFTSRRSRARRRS
jgi:hypothetical protein